MTDTLRTLLNRKNRAPITVAPDATLRDAGALLLEHRIGALPVVDEDVLVGVVSERDLLRRAIVHEDLDEAAVDEIMTRKVIVAVESDTIDRAMGMMTEGRVRHLPVMRDGGLVGIVSIGDVVDAARSDEQHELRFLRDYVYGLR